jgi:Putative glucoamylase/Protein of unknown function (DUF3131)
MNHFLYPSRRQLLVGGAALAAGLVLPTFPTLAASAVPPVHANNPPTRPQLIRWASDTWSSLVAMADPGTGLVSDKIPGTLTGRVHNTSPTNIGGYLWSCVVARDLGIITPDECRQRIAQTLTTLARMEHHRPSGMYYNWYDVRDGSVLTTWPENGDMVYPFVSSVDMGWLGAALWVVANADPSNRKAALALYDRCRWDVFFDRSFWRRPGANFGGFYTAPNPTRTDLVQLPPLNGVGGADVWYTANHHYDTAVSESRMINYLGIMRGQIPGGAYYATWRTFPVDWTWPEMPPIGQARTYLGVDVYEGVYRYPYADGLHVVPGWGGSMFEELMPDLFVPEATWAPGSWGKNHPNHVASQIYHGMVDAHYGYWGFSPSNDPYGGYREYGVDALGLNPDGYFSDEEKTNYNPFSPPTTYGDGVVTPHASFLAMLHAPAEARANLVGIQNTLGAYGPGGFYDAVGTRSGKISRWHLSLDQSMIMGAIGNVIRRDGLRRYFATASAEAALRPVISPEQFSI